MIKPIIKLKEGELMTPIIKFEKEKKLDKPIRKGVANTELVPPRISFYNQLTKPEIYVPQVTNSANYIKIKENLVPQELADRIKERIIFKVFGDDLYYFRWDLQTYQKLSGLKPLQLFNKILTEMDLRPSSPFIYREIERCLLYDSALLVSDEISLDTVWAFKNSLLNIESMRTMVNRGQYFIRNTFQCEYNAAATCPNFDLFLRAVSGNDPYVIELIWEVCGYILSSDMTAKNFFTFLGPKDTGKSLLANIIASFFSHDQISALDISDFGQRFALSELDERRLNLCMDLTDEVIPGSAVGKIKSVTGNDIIRAEKKYREGKAFRNKAKLLFGSNHPLRIAKPDTAFYDRQIVIPFYFPIPEEKQDRNLAAKLLDELPGIANKALEAYKRLRGNNYIFPKGQKRLMDSVCYDDEKIIQDFGMECLDFSDRTAKTHTQVLYSEYEKNCIEKGVAILEDVKEFSVVFNRIFGTQVERKKINIQGKILQGYIGVKIKNSRSY